MKLWKKTAAFLLCLGFGFSAVGCDFGQGENSSTPESSSPTESSAPTESAPGPDSSTEATTPDDPLTLVEVLSTAKSALIELDASFEVSAWQVNEEDTLESVFVAAEADIDMIVSQTEDGDVAAEVTAELSLGDGETTVSRKEKFFYLDGFVYSYNQKENVCTALSYNVADMLAGMGVTSEQVQTILDEVLTALEGEGVTSDSVNDAIMDIFETNPTLENGAMLIVLDAKQPVNEALAYLGTLTIETTLGDIVNDILEIGATGEETPATYETLLAQLAAENIGEMTVGELYDALDGFVLDSTEQTIQQWKDTLIANADVLAALTAAGMPTETIEEIADADIEDLLANYTAMTVDDLLEMLAESGSSEETVSETTDDTTSGEVTEETTPPTVNDILTVIENTLSTMTLADVLVATGAFEETSVEAFFATWKEVTDFRFEKLASKVGIRYDKGNNVDGIVFGEEISVGGKWTFYSSEGASLGEKDISVEMEASLVINEFSAEIVSIALPESAKMKYMCAKCDGVYETGITYDEDMCAYICEDCAAAGEEISSPVGTYEFFAYMTDENTFYVGDADPQNGVTAYTEDYMTLTLNGDNTFILNCEAMTTDTLSGTWTLAEIEEELIITLTVAEEGELQATYDNAGGIFITVEENVYWLKNSAL